MVWPPRLIPPVSDALLIARWSLTACSPEQRPRSRGRTAKHRPDSPWPEGGRSGSRARQRERAAIRAKKKAEAAEKRSNAPTDRPPQTNRHRFPWRRIWRISRPPRERRKLQRFQLPSWPLTCRGRKALNLDPRPGWRFIPRPARSPITSDFKSRRRAAAHTGARTAISLLPAMDPDAHPEKIPVKGRRMDSFRPGTMTSAVPHGETSGAQSRSKDFSHHHFPAHQSLFQSLGYSPAVATILGLRAECPRRKSSSKANPPCRHGSARPSQGAHQPLQQSRRPPDGFPALGDRHQTRRTAPLRR
jgi:hypothetical protein